LQDKIISSVVDKIRDNAQLARAMTARKVNDATIELTLRKTAFLPSFAEGVNVNSILVRHGLLYLGFGF